MSCIGKLGINEDDHVVLYDTVGVFSSPRGLFTFKGKSTSRSVLRDQEWMT